MRVADVMTRAVVTAEPRTTFKEAVDLMVAHSVSALPVVDDLGRVIGIVSEADLMPKAAYPGAPRAWKAGARTVGDVMTTRPLCVHPGDTVPKAARMLVQGRYKRAPVVDENGFLLGVVSRVDLLGAFARPDAVLLDEVEAALADPTVTPEGHGVAAHVADGIVTLAGAVDTEADRRVVAAAVWHVPGVVDVVDRMDVARPTVRLP